MARLCFLFNHDQIHQIAHSLPIAVELSRSGNHSVTLATGDDRLEEYIKTLLGPDIARLTLVNLGLTSHATRIATTLLEKVIPARKVLLYRDNLDFFAGFDALVVSEKTSLLLKTRYGLADLKIIHTRHGAGDRAIGFSKESAQFDLALVAGTKIADRLQKDAGVDPAKIRITGYPKFDLFGDNQLANPFSDQSRPIVLYTPHPSPKLSSYYTMGRRVLSAFAASERYNLIFAPHIMLFERPWTVTIAPPALRRVPQIESAIAKSSNILIDQGSAASADMSYTNLADLYLGDVSSQIYEFLVRPRPVLHLNAHEVDWRNDDAYRHWAAGQVAGPDCDIIDAADNAIATHDTYLPVQKTMLEETFSITEQPSSIRAAEAISKYLTGAGGKPV